MNEINDKELDLMFSESAHRQKAVEQISHQVMRTIRRDILKRKVRRWARLLAFCFGLPAAVVMYIFLLRAYMPALPQELTVCCYAIPLTAIIGLAAKRLHDFTPDL